MTTPNAAGPSPPPLLRSSCPGCLPMTRRIGPASPIFPPVQPYVLRFQVRRLGTATGSHPGIQSVICRKGKNCPINVLVSDSRLFCNLDRAILIRSERVWRVGGRWSLRGHAEQAGRLLRARRPAVVGGVRPSAARCRCWPRMRITPLYRYSVTGLESVDRTSLAAEQIRERQDLQRVLRERIDVLGDDLLVVAEEYGQFEDSRRRVDLLALDRKGTLVVIELKRTDDGGHMELQSLRYAAMVSTMTVGHLVSTYADANGVDVQEARSAIAGLVEEPLDELPDHVRIILVSADFSTEITSTVIWLNGTYNTDISCYRIVPYRLGAEVLLDLQQIIPLPEAKDF